MSGFAHLYQQLRPFNMPDFAGGHLRAIQLEQQLKDAAYQQKQRELGTKVSALMGSALQGNIDSEKELAQLAPQQFLQLKEFQTKALQNQSAQDKAQLDIAGTEQKQAIERLPIWVKALDTVAENPQAYLTVKAQLEGQKLIPKGLLPDTYPGPQAVEQQRIIAHELHTALQDPTKVTPEMQTAGAQVGYDVTKPGVLEKALQDPKFQAQLEKVRAEENKAKSTNVTVNTGDTTVPPTLATQTKAQESVIGSLKTLGNLDAIAKSYKSEFLTYAGQIKGWSLQKLEKLGYRSEAGKKALKERTDFVNSVEQEFNAYRQHITGAGASIAELDRLKQSMLNKDQSPSEFEASLTNYKNSAQRVLELSQYVLSKGIPVGSAQYGQEIDRLFLGNQ